jgi:hypothetical protein
MSPQFIIVHHTGGSDANPLQDSSNFTFKQCEEQHKISFNFRSSLGYYCGYQYYIEKNGALYKAREDDEEGAHTINYNKSSIGVCLAGNFDLTMPTSAQIATLKDLLYKKVAQWSIPRDNIVPHRKFANKTCFGRKLPDTWARDLILETVKPMTKDQIIVEINRLLQALKNSA